MDLLTVIDKYYTQHKSQSLDDSSNLDKQYSPSQWTTRLTPETIVGNHVETMVSATKNARSNINCETGVKYSDLGPNCLLDIYNPAEVTKGTPVFVFIHGGYWQECSRDVSGHAAESVTKMGAIYVGIGYDLCPSVSMAEIVAQVQAAFQFIRHRFPYTVGIHIMGHSAGAHLATMILAQNSHDFPSLLPVTIYAVSGVFDLRPIVETSVNNALKMTMEDAEEISPMDARNFKKIYANSRQSTRFIICIAENDSPAFHDQSVRFYEMLNATGVQCDFIEFENTDHFNIVEKSTDPNYLMNDVIKNQLSSLSTK